MGRHRSSRVRSYFEDDIDKNYVVCKVKTIDNDTQVRYCNTKIKHCNSTCSMINHLKIHKINFDQEHESKKHDDHNQASIKQAFDNIKPYDKTSPRYIELTNCVANYIIRESRPFSTVESSAFKALMYQADKRYILRSRQRFANEILSERFEKFKTSVSEKLKTAEYFNFTTDCWSKFNNSYMGLTIHFVGPDFKLNSIQLALKHLLEPHNSEYLKAQIENTLHEWKVADQTFTGCSDTAANIKRCINELMQNVTWIPCFCHVLNLVVKDLFEIRSETSDPDEISIENLIKKCRKLVGSFKHSNILSKKLKDYFISKESESKTFKLKQDVPTRWNSTFIMCQSVFKLHDGIKHALNLPENEDLARNILKDHELIILRELLELLEPIFDFTVILSGSRYPTSLLTHFFTINLKFV